MLGVDIRLHFSQWPREWQRGAAGWLSRRAEGGFAREVLSHWVYLSERLFGPAELRHAMTRYPDGDGAETHLHAELDCDGLAVSVAGSIGGAGPDLIEFTVWGSRRSCRIYDWNRLRVSDGGDWREEMTEIVDARQHGYRQHLDRAAAAFASEDHAMASFRDALSVQVLIEAMLLSLTGGLIGVLFGLGASALISLAMREQGFHAVVTLSSVLLATLFAAAVGLFFGIYPARRAARLNPIEALRYE